MTTGGLSLADRRAIEHVLFEYCNSVDRGALDRVVGLFTPDASVDYGPMASASGRGEIMRLFRELLGSCCATSHRISNICIEPSSPERATAVSYVSAWHDLRTPTGTMLLVHGRYHDRFHRLDDRWQIEHRRLEVHDNTLPLRFHRLARRELRPRDPGLAAAGR